MTWSTAYLETRVLSADPVDLIAMSYEFATLRVHEARGALAKSDIAERWRAISKAIAILGELESSLDYKQGGEIAYNLARLYRYMTERLTQANVRQEDGPLAEVESLLKILGEAWQSIRTGSGTAADIAPDREVSIKRSSLAFIDSAASHSAQVWSA
jgi:flagellar secretion chaperone FliS